MGGGGRDEAVGGGGAPGPRARGRFAQSLLGNRSARTGAAIVALLLAFAALGPVLATRDPNASDFVSGVSPSMGPVGPGHAMLLGADRLFRDELARLAHGARISLLVGLAATAIASAIGAAVGIVAGWYEGSEGMRVSWALVIAGVAAVALVVAGHPRGALVAVGIGGAAHAVGAAFAVRVLRHGPRVNADTALMRAVDVGLSFPFLLLVMAIGAALDRTSVTTILAILGLTGWLGTARVIRAKTMVVRRLDYVTAARALGRSAPAILVHHVLPNVMGPLVVIATISVAQMIVAESVLGYLGVGISLPTATWGRMLFEGQDYYLAAPWLVLAPASAIFLAVLGFNLLGEGLRDALDPKQR